MSPYYIYIYIALKKYLAIMPQSTNPVLPINHWQLTALGRAWHPGRTTQREEAPGKVSSRGLQSLSNP